MGTCEAVKDPTYSDCTLETLAVAFKHTFDFGFGGHGEYKKEGLKIRHLCRPLNLQPVKYFSKQLLELALKKSVAMNLEQLEKTYDMGHIHLDGKKKTEELVWDEENGKEGLGEQAAEEYHKLSFVVFIQRPRLFNLSEIFNTFDEQMPSDEKQLSIGQYNLHPLGEKNITEQQGANTNQDIVSASAWNTREQCGFGREPEDTMHTGSGGLRKSEFNLHTTSCNLRDLGTNSSSQSSVEK